MVGFTPKSHISVLRSLQLHLATSEYEYWVSINVSWQENRRQKTSGPPGLAERVTGRLALAQLSGILLNYVHYGNTGFSCAALKRFEVGR